MRILFIHQNFPGQFRYLAPALQKAGHDVLALAEGGRGLPNVPLARYQRPSLKINSPLISGGMERDVHQGIMPLSPWSVCAMWATTLIS